MASLYKKIMINRHSRLDTFRSNTFFLSTRNGVDGQSNPVAAPLRYSKLIMVWLECCQSGVSICMCVLLPGYKTASNISTQVLLNGETWRARETTFFICIGTTLADSSIRSDRIYTQIPQIYIKIFKNLSLIINTIYWSILSRNTHR